MSSEHKYALPPGFRLHQYTIVRLLGHGGFGLTYLADHAKLNRQVAIKELLPVDFAIREMDGTTVVARSQQDRSNFEWARERFVEEGQTLAGLHHPSILPVHDILEEHGTAYLVTPFIDGGSMEEWLREVQRPAESDLRSVTHHILDALALVHERGYLHRDVKPQNILLDRQNGLPVLIDFGNARIASGARTSNLTSVITKGYAPFEQYQTKGRQGAFTDLYALGAVLYRSIKGVAPDDAADRWDEDKLEPLCHRPPTGYSLEFLATVDKALRIRREDRWQNCGEWRSALSVAGPLSTSPSPAPEPQPPSRPESPATLARVEPQRTEGEPAFPANTAPVSMPVARRAASRRPKSPIPMAWLLVIIPAVFFFAIIMIRVFSTPSHTAVNPSAEKSAADAPQTDIKTPLRPTQTPFATTPAPIATMPVQAAQAPLATKQAPFVNSLGQEFVPVPGTDVLFCRWDTRVSDWQAFIQEEGDVEQWGLYGLDEKEVKWVVKNELSWKNPGFAQTGQHPVVGVSWEDAHRFCAWLSKKEGRTYRLPTDAEWSAAVGSQTYPWGDNFPPPQGAGNYRGSESRLANDPNGVWWTIEGYNDGYPRTSPVGSFAANRLGLYDMGGNVWQWCEDEYRASMNSAETLEKYPKQKQEMGADGTAYRVLRGGAWREAEPIALRSTIRRGDFSRGRHACDGFRCVLAVSGERPPALKPAPLAPAKEPAATKQKPFVNSLGQEFVPVPGTSVLFCRWDTRVGDWQAFVQAEGDVEQSGFYGLDEKEGKWVAKNDLSWKKPGFPQSSEHPVVGISWEDARRFCAWLSKKEGRTYRLPTDAEWSVAVGSQTYPWGENFPPTPGTGNYRGSESRLTPDPSGTSAWPTIEGYSDGYPRTSPVGNFPANRLGLYDMGGNVWQWCEDEYQASMNSADEIERQPTLKDEETSDGIPYRILRGGSWGSDDWLTLRSACRNRVDPRRRRDTYGFRCVLVVSNGAPLATTQASLARTPAPSASKPAPFVNSLGQEFVPVPGTSVLFCRWDARVRDWQAFIQAEGDVAQWGLFGLDEKEVKWVVKKQLSWKNPGFAQTGEHPVVGVSWEDAHRFCAWLSKKEGRFYRLPTDAEWSVAVGSQTYPWGNNFPPPEGAGNYCGSETRLNSDASATSAWPTIEGYNDRFPRTSPVGSFAANRLGLYDMGGNVWQWCEDEYKTSMNSAEAIKALPALQEEKASDGTHYRVVRGGSWGDFVPVFLQSASRCRSYPTIRDASFGFRCVLVVSGG